MTKKTVHSTYKLFRRGEFVREVDYTYETEVAPKERTRVMCMSEAMIAAKRAREEATENILDRFLKILESDQDNFD